MLSRALPPEVLGQIQAARQQEMRSSFRRRMQSPTPSARASRQRSPTWKHVHMVRSMLRRDEMVRRSVNWQLCLFGDHRSITAYLGDRIDTYKTGAVRSVLAAVDQFAHKH